MLKKMRENITKDEMSVIIRHALFIFLISSVIGFAVNLFHPKGFVLVSKESEKNKNIVFISSEEAKIKREGLSAIFIDSRPEDEFELSHIPGAINIPAVHPESKIKEYSGALNSEKELVIYCDGTECGSSQILANILIEMKYSRHIYIIKNGIPEWTEKGFPLEEKTTTDNNN
jgi:rhodanese-related sulfurtransferase